LIEGESKCLLTLQWDIMGDLQARPNHLTLRTDNNGNGSLKDRRLEIRSRSGRPFKVISVKAPEGVIVKELSGELDRIIYNVSGQAPESEEFTIRFETDREDEGALYVDLSADHLSP